MERDRECAAEWDWKGRKFFLRKLLLKRFWQEFMLNYLNYYFRVCPILILLSLYPANKSVLSLSLLLLNNVVITIHISCQYFSLSSLIDNSYQSVGSFSPSSVIRSWTGFLWEPIVVAASSKFRNSQNCLLNALLPLIT